MRFRVTDVFVGVGVGVVTMNMKLVPLCSSVFVHVGLSVCVDVGVGGCCPHGSGGKDRALRSVVVRGSPHRVRA